MLQACLNGPREPGSHPALPLTAEALAADAAACVRAGAHALHLHPRAESGQESLQPNVVDETVRRVRAAARVPVGVATGAWVEPDPERRAALVGRWTQPDYASVNLSETGASAVMRALLSAGIGIEAGVWSVEDAEALAATGLADKVLRVLVEVIDVREDRAAAAAREIDAALDRCRIDAPRLHHGEGDATWPVLQQALAAERDTRIGFEDTLFLPDGRPAASNAQLVAAATRFV